jgi:hypothetical protein
MRIDPGYYREKAYRTLMLYKGAETDEAKAYVVTVAQRYGKLAAELEQKA